MFVPELLLRHEGSGGHEGFFFFKSMYVAETGMEIESGSEAFFLLKGKSLIF